MNIGVNRFHLHSRFPFSVLVDVALHHGKRGCCRLCGQPVDVFDPEHAVCERSYNKKGGREEIRKEDHVRVLSCGFRVEGLFFEKLKKKIRYESVHHHNKKCNTVMPENVGDLDDMGEPVLGIGKVHPGKSGE